MAEINTKVSKIFLGLTFALSVFLSLFPKPHIGVGVLIAMYGVFLATQSVRVSTAGVHYKSFVGSKTLFDLESIQITDLLFLNSITFVGKGGTKIIFANAEKIKEIKELAEKIRTKKK